MTNNQITIIRYSEDNDEYEKIAGCSAWVFLKKGISSSTKGDESSDVMHIRVERRKIQTVKTGDLVYIGHLSKDEDVNLAECKKITRVADNNFGSIPHWHFEVGA